jgi:hypothetical protein
MNHTIHTLTSRRGSIQLCSTESVEGVSKVSNIADFFTAGAEAVLCGSSRMHLPQVALEAKTTHPNW